MASRSAPRLVTRRLNFKGQALHVKVKSSYYQMYHAVYMYAQVHPIFVLSIADLMLAMLWLLGGGLWLRRDVNMSRVWCFSASLMTVVSTHCIHMWCCETAL